MTTIYKVFLKRIDLVDKKLFLFPKKELDRKFKVKRNNIVFEISLGLTENLPNIYAHTNIEFEAELDTNLALFEKEIPLIVDSEYLKIESTENVELKESKEAERIKLEEQLRDLFPIVLEAFNTFRSACKVALYKESVTGRILTRNIQDSQIYWGIEPDTSLEDHFSGNDTEYLFDAFANLSLTSFTGDADIMYRVSNEEGKVYEGVFKNGYKGLHSVNRFFENLDKIQNLVEQSWSIETEVLLGSLEFLYSDNYRMAVFNAATILELIVKRFWLERLDEDTRKKLRPKIKSYQNEIEKKEKYKPDQVNYIIGAVLPDYLDKELVASGCLGRCITAWNLRNSRLAHMYKQAKDGQQIEVTRKEAWSAVASIFDLVDNLDKLSS